MIWWHVSLLLHGIIIVGLIQSPVYSLWVWAGYWVCIQNVFLLRLWSGTEIMYENVFTFFWSQEKRYFLASSHSRSFVAFAFWTWEAKPLAWVTIQLPVWLLSLSSSCSVVFFLSLCLPSFFPSPFFPLSELVQGMSCYPVVRAESRGHLQQSPPAQPNAAGLLWYELRLPLHPHTRLTAQQLMWDIKRLSPALSHPLFFCLSFFFSSSVSFFQGLCFWAVVNSMLQLSTGPFRSTAWAPWPRRLLPYSSSLCSRSSAKKYQTLAAIFAVTWEQTRNMRKTHTHTKTSFVCLVSFEYWNAQDMQWE